ncbi:homocysteine S-methyltransferase family protein [uncultured Cocleimonas sp.]|uniref:homocysteine S-methyltransferase family protein n=1 Tax=uncultured Cocleimonas sp. TaxID=1051587 RepID=UPI00261FB535|nr:homocysteine S-methyltransferase family protein [uncultured Cocleimonas sp.]
MITNKQKITVLDGGMGQELLKRSKGEVTPLWSTQVMIDEPEIVRDLHIDFIRAGARVIVLNAYTMTPERLARDGIIEDFEALQLAAINAATSAWDIAAIPGVKIAGCLPPLVASYHAEVAPDYEDMLVSYGKIVAVQAPHVDMFLCETLSSIAEAKAALIAAKKSGLPVWVSLTIQDNDLGLLRSGEKLSDAVAMLDENGADAKFLNCSKPEFITAALPILDTGKGPIGAYANGFTSIDSLKPGGVVTSLESRSDLGPEAYAEFALEWAKQGVEIIGGCCEVGPEHIAVMAKRLAEEGYSV